jgi:polyisoprenoid-binding protein YceI
MRLRLMVLLGAMSFIAPLRATETPLTIDFVQSRIEIAVKATVDSFVGRLRIFEPEVTVGDDGRVATARLAFHFGDVVTGKEKRDKAMHEWQRTAEFPDGRFEMTALESASGGVATAFGRMTFHGVTRDIRFPITVTRDGPRYSIDGDAAIDTRDYGLPKIRMMGLLTVDPLVHVRFHLQGTRGNATASQP